MTPPYILQHLTRGIDTGEQDDDPFASLPDADEGEDPFAALPERPSVALSSATQRRFGRVEQGVDLQASTTPEAPRGVRRILRDAGQLAAGTVESLPFMTPGGVTTEGLQKIVALGSTPWFDYGKTRIGKALGIDPLPHRPGQKAPGFRERLRGTVEQNPWPVSKVAHEIGGGLEKVHPALGAPVGKEEELFRLGGGLVGPVAGHRAMNRIRARIGEQLPKHEQVLDRSESIDIPIREPTEPAEKTRSREAPLEENRRMLGIPKGGFPDTPEGRAASEAFEADPFAGLPDRPQPPAMGQPPSVSGRAPYVPQLEPPALGELVTPANGNGRPAANGNGRLPPAIGGGRASISVSGRAPYAPKLEPPALGGEVVRPFRARLEQPEPAPTPTERGPDRRQAAAEAWERAGAPRAGDLSGPAAIEAAQQRVGGKRFAEEVTLELKAMEMSKTPGGQAAAEAAVARDILGRDRRLKQSKLELTQGGDRRDADRPDSRAEPPAAPATEVKRPSTPVGGVQGRADRVKLSDQTSHQIEYRWAPIESVHGSINPETFRPSAPEQFRAGIQQRVYSKADMESIADRSEKNRLNPDRSLDPTRSIEAGPPTVTMYGEAVSGTERVTRIKRAARHDPEAYAEYLRRAREDAVDFGLDPAAMTEPGILVRVLVDQKLDQENVGQLARMNERSDKSQMKLKGRFAEGVGRAGRFRDAEGARSHFTDTIGPDQSVRDYLGTGTGREFIQKLVADGVIDPAEKAAYLKEGHATEEGKQLIEHMLRGAAFGDVETLERAAPSILNKFDPVLGPIAKTGGMKGYELQPRLQRTFKLIADAGEVTDLEAFYGQADALRAAPDPADLALAKFFQKAPRSQLAAAVRRYTSLADEAVKQLESESMFGDKPQTAQELLDRAIRESKPEPKATEKQIDLEGGFVLLPALLRTGLAGAGVLGSSQFIEEDDSWWEKALKIGVGAALGASTPDMAKAIHAKGLEVREAIRKIGNPGARSEGAKVTEDLMRWRNAEMAQSYEQAEHALKGYRDQLNKLPIAERQAFIDNIEKGVKQGNPLLDQPAAELRRILDEKRDQVRALGTGKLNSFYRTYFPHIWKDPKAATEFVDEFLRRRPLEGSKAFLKQRTYPTMAEGLAAGLEPVSDNPVDLTMLKLREMDRYIFGQRLLADLKQQGFVRFAPGLRSGPDGYAKLDDKIGTIFGSPEIPITEAFDAVVRQQLTKFLKDLKIKHSRSPNIGRSNALGLAFKQPEEMKTLFGGPDTVIEHELGHILDYRYDLWNAMVQPAPRQSHTVKRGKRAGQTIQRATPQKDAVVQERKLINEELRNLADLRDQGQPPASPTRKSYLHNQREKIANSLHALIYAPELMEATAPTLKKRLTDFLASHPELKPLLEIKPTLTLGASQASVRVKGTVITGQYWLPEPVAHVINNHLSPGLRGNAIYDSYMSFGNLLNQAQLGLSAFHFGFTSMEAMVSKNANAIRQTLRGDVVAAGKSIATSAVAPVTNILTGHKLRKAYLVPGSQGPVFDAMVKNVVLAGGRINMDSFYRNNSAGKFREALKSRKLIPAAWHGFAAGLEGFAWPVLEWLVPRQKLGVFYDLAKEELARLPSGSGPEATRAAMAKAWDSADNRLGQMVYDNLFWDRTFKDAAMGLVRSVGWNLGTKRELLGGMADLGRGRMTSRAAYAISLPFTTAIVGAVYHYLATGQAPQELKDYFYPKTGHKNTDGSDERMQLPTYMKDVMAYSKHPLKTLGHKAHPALHLIISMLGNEDFYGDRIRNAEDPLVVQIKQVMGYMAKQFIPFGVSNALEEEKRGGQGWKQKAQPFVGITPAPRWATRTKAENRMMEIFQYSRQSGGSPQDAERRTLVSEAVRKLREGDVPGFRETVGGSPLTTDDLAKVFKRAQEDPWVARFKRLSVDEAQEVFQLSTPQEKGKYAPILIDKIERAGQAAGKNEGLRGLLQPEP